MKAEKDDYKKLVTVVYKEFGSIAGYKMMDWHRICHNQICGAICDCIAFGSSKLSQDNEAGVEPQAFIQAELEAFISWCLKSSVSATN